MVSKCAWFSWRVALIFSLESDVTLVVTSCGRFDLLARTLASFDRFNTAPIREVVITEDSGSEQVHAAIPEHWKEHVLVHVNVPKLGQLASIDLAYSQVKTPFIFHCEDDWFFYRPGFIEDSRCVLDSDPLIMQVWLRSYAHDIQVHSSYHHLGVRRHIGGVACYPVLSDKPEWQGFSFNPGLRRLADYQLLAPYSDKSGEKFLSTTYAAQGFSAMILEADAVLHTGFGAHVEVSRERQRKKQRSKREKLRLLMVGAGMFLAGILAGVIFL